MQSLQNAESVETRRISRMFVGGYTVQKSSSSYYKRYLRQSQEGAFIFSQLRFPGIKKSLPFEKSRDTKRVNQVQCLKLESVQSRAATSPSGSATTIRIAFVSQIEPSATLLSPM